MACAAAREAGALIRPWAEEAERTPRPLPVRPRRRFWRLLAAFLIDYNRY
jgi:hypothetical protein